MTTIEKVANVILDGIGEDCCHKEQARWVARAVIEAMRDPSPEMCRRGGRFIGLSPADNTSMRLAFVDMIDTALMEKIE